MAIIVCLLAAFLVAVEARPNSDMYKFVNLPGAHDFAPTLTASNDAVDWYIIGGSNASPGAWPWQLSQQRLGTSWSHSCGASLLSSRYGLSASHCVDGSAASNLRVIAGLHDRTVTTGTQTANIESYKMHEQYNTGAGTYANDIAILTFATTVTIGGSVQTAALPPDNGNTFAGQTCTITGWGRTSSSNVLPNILQQANIGIISSTDCNSRMGSIATITANHICVFDTATTSGACNGDSGGPINCPQSGGYYVTGIASFVVSSGGACNVNYPSAYTRVSAYLSWIASNTP